LLATELKFSGGVVENRHNQKKIAFTCSQKKSEQCLAYDVYYAGNPDTYWEFQGNISAKKLDDARRSAMGEEFAYRNKVIAASNVFLTLGSLFGCVDGDSKFCVALPFAVVLDIAKIPLVAAAQVGANIYTSLTSFRFRFLTKYLTNSRKEGKTKKVGDMTFFYLKNGLRHHFTRM